MTIRPRTGIAPFAAALDVPPEEVQPLVDVGDQGLLLGQAQTHRGEDPGDLRPQRHGVLAGAVHAQAPVVRVPGQPVVGQTMAPSFGCGDPADPGSSRSVGDVLVQDREGHVAQQRG